MITDIPQKELETRRQAIVKDLTDLSLDALLIPLGINFYYLFGKQGMPTERIITGVIPTEGDPFILSPSFERSNIEISTGLEDIAIWKETDNAYAILNREFNDRNIGKNIGVDPKLWIVEKERIEKYSKRHLTSVGHILDKHRMVKSSWELKQLREATKSSAKGILNALKELYAGITEKEFASIVNSKMTELSNNPPSFTAIQFGENSAIPHGRPTDRRLKNNEVVLVDAGTSVNGYQGDITITIPFGEPKDFNNIYEIVFEANRKAFEANMEGVAASELDQVARDHIDKKGYAKYFTHRLGHGIGLEVHEEPYIVASNHEKLLSGNCHTIEPGIYIPGKFGVRIEDDVLVTKTGAELLFNTPRHNF